MPITTYLDEVMVRSWEIELDADVHGVLREVRHATHERWAIQPSTKMGLWRSTTSYRLYAWIQGEEWQLINFYQEGTGTSINTAVSKDSVMAYLSGYLAGRATDVQTAQE